ncbi:hypothetical protein [Flavobacterium daemonense]|uniref:hypothetical protein n=1 Tax=Flavobacterium daemonense TaxID=1393049 RepID=UPI0011846C6B|nr:hypothetical protein [Flavobacterium daemonense]KAF2333257.1 hypothetical protein FND99_11530 [Flavobacterium daemonense]
MAAKKPEEMSNEELLKNETILKTIMYLLIFFAVILLAAGIWLIIEKKQFNALTITPMMLGIIVMVNANNLKALKKERKSRGL